LSGKNQKTGMHRRKFLISTVTATALGPCHGESTRRTKKIGPGLGFIVKAGEARFGEKTKLFGHTPNDIKVSGKDTGGTLSFFEYNGKQKGGPPLHKNVDQDEIYYIIEGRYLFDVAGDRSELTAGDLIFAPRETAHTFAQLTVTGRMTILIQPSGKMEEYFRTLGSLTGELSEKQAIKLFADHGMQILGPPIPID
jgi:quercetin 2,3-dioxygenase